MKEVDLGRALDSGCPPCSPCPPPVSESSDKKYYPSLYVDGVPEIDLADEGVALVRYKLRSKSEKVGADEGKKCSYDIEIRSITPKSGCCGDEEDDDPNESAEEAMHRKLRVRKSDY